MSNTWKKLLSGFISICATFTIFLMNDAQAQASGQVTLKDVNVTYEGEPLGFGARIDGNDNGAHWTIYISAAQLKNIKGALDGFPYWDGEGNHKGKKTTGTFKFKNKRGSTEDGFTADLVAVVEAKAAYDPVAEDLLVSLE